MFSDSDQIVVRSRPWGALLFVAVFLFSPFYFYGSGLPQPAHIIILLASLALVWINRKSCLSFLLINWAAVSFLSLVFIVNSSYGYYYLDYYFLVSSVYWGYGYLLFFAIWCVAADLVLVRLVSGLIILKLFLIVLAYLIGLGGYTWWPRYDYYFNGPNQLAYFVLCAFLVYVAIDNSRYSLGFWFAYALSLFLILSTGGRSAYVALLPLLMLLLWMARKYWVRILFLLFIPLLVSIFFKYYCLPAFAPSDNGNKRVSCQSRSMFGDSTVVTSGTIDRLRELTADEKVLNNNSVWLQLRARGYARVLDYPSYLLYGAGQGRDERFGDVDGHVYEIHSSLLALVFYYGVLGFLLFMIFVYKSFLNKSNILFLAPVFVYGMFTYGLRSPYFWVVLGFAALMPNLLASDREENST